MIGIAETRSGDEIAQLYLKRTTATTLKYILPKIIHNPLISGSVDVTKSVATAILSKLQTSKVIFLVETKFNIVRVRQDQRECDQ